MFTVRKLIVLSILFLFMAPNAKAQSNLWAKSIGDTSNNYGRIFYVDADGNSYIITNYKGTLDFDPGPGIYNLTAVGQTDCCILKLDPSGNFVWAKSYGSIDEDFQSTGVGKHGAIYLSGFFTQTTDFDPGSNVFDMTPIGFADQFVLKLDTAGNFIWVKNYGGSLGILQPWCINVDNFGNVFTTGRFYSTIDFDPGPGVANCNAIGETDIFIAKLDSNGNFVWAKSMGSPVTDEGYSIYTDLSGNVYVVGRFSLTVDFDPGPLLDNKTVVGNMDCFVTKFDSAGSYNWTQTFGSINYDAAYEIIPDNSGNIYVGGLFQGSGDFDPGPAVFNLQLQGTTDMFVQKLDSSGNFIWANSLGSAAGSLSAYPKFVDANDVLYITGNFQGTLDLDPGPGNFTVTSLGISDGFFSKWTNTGTYLSTQLLSGPYRESISSYYLNSNNTFYISGIFTDTLDFGSPLQNSVVSNGQLDFFIAKYSLNSLGIIENSQINEITIFPNPTDNEITISLPETAQKIEVKISNVLAQEIYKNSFINSNKLQIEINAKAGIYFMKVNADGFDYNIFKIIKLD